MSDAADTRECEEKRSLVEAAAWRAYLGEQRAESSVEFETWLAADPRHEVAWRQVQAPWQFFGEHAAAPELIEARRAALGRARQVGARRWRAPSLVGRIAATVAILAVITMVGVARWQADRGDAYRTGLGERRVVTLRDGSRISLDSQSELRVRYSEQARDLTLTRGQARFDVAHDVERPFTVLAADQKIVATGTAFNVDLLGARLLVTLIEGSVVVLPQVAIPASPASGTHGERAAQAPGDLRSAPINLRAGEQLVVSPTGLPAIEPVNVERAVAWEAGRLVFENEPLSSVVARINRYTDRPVIVADERAAGLRISGVFNTGDVAGFVATLTSYLPVRATPGEGGAIELRHGD